MLRERSARASPRSHRLPVGSPWGEAGAPGSTPGAPLMITAGNTARSLRRRAPLAVVGLALLLPGASAASAAGASLRITVSPVKVRPGEKYTITVVGRFEKRELRGTAYLWEFLQYTSAACQPTAQAEDALPSSVLSLDFRGKEDGSPFTRLDHWKAGTYKGVRHVCAYLYPKVVSASSTVRPIAAADARLPRRVAPRLTVPAGGAPRSCRRRRGCRSDRTATAARRPKGCWGRRSRPCRTRAPQPRSRCDRRSRRS